TSVEILWDRRHAPTSCRTCRCPGRVWTPVSPCVAQTVYTASSLSCGQRGPDGHAPYVWAADAAPAVRRRVLGAVAPDGPALQRCCPCVQTGARPCVLIPRWPPGAQPGPPAGPRVVSAGGQPSTRASAPAGW